MSPPCRITLLEHAPALHAGRLSRVNVDRLAGGGLFWWPVEVGVGWSGGGLDACVGVDVVLFLVVPIVVCLGVNGLDSQLCDSMMLLDRAAVHRDHQHQCKSTSIRFIDMWS